MSDITDMQNSLNINFTGIHAFEYLFSVELYEKLDQDEISWMFFWLKMATVIHSAKSISALKVKFPKLS